MSKEKFLQIRISEKKHQEIKDFCKEKDTTMSKFIIDAITDKMRRMHTNIYNKELMGKVKELSKKLNGVKKQTNNTKALLEKQESTFEKQFKGYKDVKETIEIIQEVFRKKSQHKEVGYTQGDIVKRSGLPRDQVFYALRYSNLFEKTNKGRWVLK